MWQVLKYGVCLLILLPSNLEAQKEEGNELKAYNLLKETAQLIKSVVLYLEQVGEPSSEKHLNDIIDFTLIHLKESMKYIEEARDFYPICKRSQHYEKPMDCSEVLANGNILNGIYTVWPRNRLFGGNSISVYCDMLTDGGGWTVIQRRGNFSNQQNFYQDWEQYKNGFGDKEKDFWLGNDYIHAITNQGDNEIRFDLQDVNGKHGFAQYSSFWIDNEDSSYALHISNYTGNVGDCMKHHNNMTFSTKDKGNTNYARFYKGGWWYNNWAHSNLNGRYTLDKASVESVHWWYWTQNRGLSGVEIKIRPR